MDDGLFDDRIAARYDADVAAMADPEVLAPTIDLLADLAGDGRALEFAIGTGRVALPLRARGVDVAGIELSQAMVDQLRAKPGGTDIYVIIGDMATARCPERFSLVFLVFNTITNLLSQDDQVRCFANAAAHLEPGGYFVIETGVPQLRRLPPGETRVLFDTSPHHIGYDTYDVVSQRFVSHHTWIDGDRVTTFESQHRWAWPAEYDLMARLAGLEPRHRWADWSKARFTADSTSHVSVWQKP